MKKLFLSLLFPACLFGAQQDLDFVTPDNVFQGFTKIQANFDDVYDGGLSAIYQVADADLTTYAGITPSANVQSLLGSANYAAMRTLLDLEAGTDFYSIAAADAAFQAADADLLTWAGITPSANLQTWFGTSTLANLNTLMGTTLADGAHTTEVNNLGTAVTWANVPDANITESSVTQHEAALTLANQIAGGTDGQVLTSDGLGAAAWESVPAGGISNVVEDITPQLGGPLDVNGQEIQSAGNVVFQLGDNAGVNKVSIQDSDSAEVGLWDSDGNLRLNQTSNYAVNFAFYTSGAKSFNIYGSNTSGILRVNNTDALGVFNNRIEIPSTFSFGWNSGTNLGGGSTDLSLYRDAAGTLAQRNSTNPQTFNIYNTYTDASNYERGFLKWNSNVLEIGTEAAGTGTARGIKTNVSAYTLQISGANTLIADQYGVYVYKELYSLSNFRKYTTAGITASATQTQGQSALTRDINEVSTVATTNDVVTLPSAAAGKEITIINNGANTLQIFPASGDNLGAGVDTSTTLAAGSNVRFVAYDSTNWETI